MTKEDWRGKVGKLDGTEVDDFLSGAPLLRLACLDGDGWPYAVPCWFEWDGESFWVVPRERAAWGRYLAAEPRCAFTIDEEGAQRKVTGQAHAHLIEEPNVGGAWVPIATRMSARYLGANGPKYLEPTLDKPRWLFRLEPVKIQTWQGQDWAAKYK